MRIALARTLLVFIVLMTISSIADAAATKSQRELAQLYQQIQAAKDNARGLYSKAHREEANASGLHDGLMRDYSQRIHKAIDSGGTARSQAKNEIRNRMNSVLALYRQSIATNVQTQNAWRRVIPLIRGYFVPKEADRQVRGIETDIKNIANEIRRVEGVIQDVQRRWTPILNR